MDPAFASRCPSKPANSAWPLVTSSSLSLQPTSPPPMTRRRRKAAGPSAVAAPDKAPIAWPDHPLAASGGEILATRILPLMGHNARDFARAAAVCRGWRDVCRAATATLRVYRETTLQANDCKGHLILAWSPCGKFVAATVSRPPRLFIWRASTGALVNEWALATPATAVSRDILESADLWGVSVAFSRDSKQLLTLFNVSGDHFAVWSVPDGQLVAVNRGAPGSGHYSCPEFGVAGSSSDGLVGFGSTRNGAVDLWDILPPPLGGRSTPQLRSHVDLVPGRRTTKVFSFAFSPDGFKFAAAYDRAAFVYDVASLTRLGMYASPWDFSRANWQPDGRHVLVSCFQGACACACVWDFSRPEAPSVVTVGIGPNLRIHSWSPSGAFYFILRKSEGQAPNGPTTYAMEERRAADGSLVRAVSLGPLGDFPRVRLSPDAHAFLMHPYDGPAPRVVVFD